MNNCLFIRGLSRQGRLFIHPILAEYKQVYLYRSIVQGFSIKLFTFWACNENVAVIHATMNTPFTLIQSAVIPFQSAVILIPVRFSLNSLQEHQFWLKPSFAEMHLLITIQLELLLPQVLVVQMPQL